MSALEAEVARWLRIAEADLRASVALIALDPPLVEQAAFHAQQAVEKTLKAVLVRHGVSPEKTHDLHRLALPVLGREPGLRALVEPLLPLSEWAVEPRYPGSGEEVPIEIEDLRWALPLLGALLAAVREPRRPLAGNDQG